ncbi:MAG: holo-[acyl-carrier-protein] synthase [Planctomycetaceae bacterium]|nr:holo-[acyl-carrier-protein] synthase [Planctomycetaceae bacterium]
MNLIGIGTDIIEVARIGEMIEKHDELFLRRVYTPLEIEYCGGRKSALQHYAGRWAAKEAALKALGTGWSRGIKWTDMEVSNLMGGKPELRIHGVASDIAEEMGIQEMQISISHCQSYAVAYVIAIGD